MSVEDEKLMEAKGLPESDREEVRDFLELLSLLAESRETRTDEARRKLRDAIEKASNPDAPPRGPSGPLYPTPNREGDETMHSKPMADPEGTFDDWKPCAAEDPASRCRECGSSDVWYREWDSNDGAYTDYKYECRTCKRTWWVGGSDS